MTRVSSILDLSLANRVEFVENMEVIGNLKGSNHNMIEYQMMGKT